MTERQPAIEEQKIIEELNKNLVPTIERYYKEFKDAEAGRATAVLAIEQRGSLAPILEAYDFPTLGRALLDLSMYRNSQVALYRYFRYKVVDPFQVDALHRGPHDEVTVVQQDQRPLVVEIFIL